MQPLRRAARAASALPGAEPAARGRRPATLWLIVCVRTAHRHVAARASRGTRPALWWPTAPVRAARRHAAALAALDKRLAISWLTCAYGRRSRGSANASRRRGWSGRTRRTAGAEREERRERKVSGRGWGGQRKREERGTAASCTRSLRACTGNAQRMGGGGGGCGVCTHEVGSARRRCRRLPLTAAVVVSPPPFFVGWRNAAHDGPGLGPKLAGHGPALRPRRRASPHVKWESYRERVCHGLWSGVGEEPILLLCAKS